MSVVAPPEPQHSDEALVREARARQRRRWMTAAVVVAMLAGVGIVVSVVMRASGARSASTTTAAGPVASARCTLSELGVHRIGSYAGLGESGGYYGLTNTSPGRCALKGWPYVVAIKSDGTRANGKNVQETFYGPFKAPPRPPAISLEPGATAAFALTTGDNPLSGTGRCPAPYTRLRIGLARGSGATTISGWIPYYGQYFQACTGFEVSEIVPKSDLRG